MSGVQSGTRLERLEAVQRAARMQRAYARWDHNDREEARLDELVSALDVEIRREQRARPELVIAVRQADAAVRAALKQLGVSAYTVKLWAFDSGLIPAVVKGRVPLAVVTAYAHAHQQQERTP